MSSPPKDEIRKARRHRDEPAKAPRTEFQRDKERILHASALRRLAGVSQVVAAHEGHVFHNRLTHVLKVAQIGRGLAEVLLHGDGAKKAASLGGLDPDVVEAASLAHDLGHPPFGHIAEHELDKLVTEKANLKEGFEGNAQSFRVVTKLAVRTEESDGLNLSRASLNSLLKYPWFRQSAGKGERKWGAYHTEGDDFAWARSGYSDDRKSLEAELMDWSDDIAYSIFDLDDFYRAGKIPLHQIFASSKDLTLEASQFLRGVERRCTEAGEKFEHNENAEIIRQLSNYNIIKEAYNGSREQRAALRTFTSTLIKRYMHKCVRLPDNAEGKLLIIDDDRKKEVALLKQLTWEYVIDNPSLATQQYGYRIVIQELFDVFANAAQDPKGRNMFPRGVRDLLLPDLTDAERTRIVVDTIASMTEQQALEMYQRLKGISFGSVLKSVM